MNMEQATLIQLVKNGQAEGKDEIDICHALHLRRWELGNLGFGTGPWTGEMWDRECRSRATLRLDLSYLELLYMPNGSHPKDRG